MVDGAGAVCTTHLGPVDCGFELIFAVDKVDERRECLIKRDGTNTSGLFCAATLIDEKQIQNPTAVGGFVSIDAGEALI